MWGTRGCGLHGKERTYRKQILKSDWLEAWQMRWMHLFPKGVIHHLAHSTSDHCPLLINTNNEKTYKKSPSFKFEAWWTMEESIEQEIKKSWESSNGLIVEKLERLQIRLIRWASSIKKGRNRLKNNLTKDLDNLLASDRDADTMAKLIDTRIQLNMEIDKDEILISLCTVLYKFVEKATANRLQEVIRKCIDKAQSAFILERLITYNVLLAYELLHTLRQKRTGKKELMAVKLDMSKAYDRVEWAFLK
ncbi:hypothetical protein PVK06_019184 [Gossypium arboreum]|uniref:Reverse transcriptase domain-containing protein n=1 Tax=Gossypium arboreum TaxID=29729 RepID=A0ABR0PJ36_GOSAR|nr:hypothetical protein PVK06_019184 [Gossypium arboreum]